MHTSHVCVMNPYSSLAAENYQLCSRGSAAHNPIPPKPPLLKPGSLVLCFYPLAFKK